MSKSLIVFCALFLACATQSVNIIDSVITSITNVQNEVESVVESTVASIETTAEEIVTELNSLVTTLAEDAETAVNDYNTEVESILSEVDSQISSLLSEISSDVSTSECLSIVDTLTDTAVSLTAEHASCVADKVAEAYGYVDEFTTEVQSLISEQYEISTATAACISDVSTFTLAGRALICTTDQLTAATLASASSITTLTTDAARFTNLIANLQSDLSTCVVVDSISVLSTQADAVVEEVQNCLSNLVS